MPRKPMTEEDKAKRRAYMRRYSSRDGVIGAREVMGSAGHEPPFSIKTANAAYLPGRDPPPRYESATASLMGDPPIGRRAIDRKPGDR